AAITALAEFPAWFDDATLILVPAAAERFHFDRLAVHANHARLIVERVDVAWAAVHEEEDHALCFCGQQRRFWRERVRESRCGRALLRKEAIAREHRGQ